jgi:hypothetical protein
MRAVEMICTKHIVRTGASRVLLIILDTWIFVEVSVRLSNKKRLVS